MDEWSESLKLYNPRHTLYAMGILTDLFLQIQIHILKPALGLQLPGGKIDKCSSICLSVHQSGRPSFLSITNHILSIILHRRRKVLNIGGGRGARFRILGGGGARGDKLFAGCKLIGAPAPNHCQIIAFLTLKTDNIAKLKIEIIKSILLEIPSNKIKGTYVKLVHL